MAETASPSASAGTPYASSGTPASPAATGSTPEGTSAPATSSAPPNGQPATGTASEADPLEGGPKRGRTKEWDDAAVERIRKAHERKAAEQAQKDADAARSKDKPKDEPAKAKETEPEKPKSGTKELLERVRADRARREAAKQADGDKAALEAERARLAGYKTAEEKIAAGDYLGALEAIKLPKDRLFTGKDSLYWKLAQLAAAQEDGEAATPAEAEAASGIKPGDVEKLIAKAIEDHDRKKAEEADRKQREAREAKEQVRTQARADYLEDVFVAGGIGTDGVDFTRVSDVAKLRPDPKRYPHIPKQGLRVADLIESFQELSKDDPNGIEADELWQKLDDHYKQFTKPSGSPVATPSAASLKGDVGTPPAGEKPQWTSAADFDRAARAKLEEIHRKRILAGG